jgi:putative NIF3 family GTP cyclohydrolase 1 type 2
MRNTAVQVALALGASFESPISSIAICAGSGGSVLGGVQADVYLTGEMQHVSVVDVILRFLNRRLQFFSA